MTKENYLKEIARESAKMSWPGEMNNIVIGETKAGLEEYLRDLNFLSKSFGTEQASHIPIMRNGIKSRRKIYQNTWWIKKGEKTLCISCCERKIFEYVYASAYEV